MANHDYTAHAQYAALSRITQSEKKQPAATTISGLAALGRYEGASNHTPSKLPIKDASPRIAQCA